MRTVSGGQRKPATATSAAFLPLSMSLSMPLPSPGMKAFPYVSLA